MKALPNGQLQLQVDDKTIFKSDKLLVPVNGKAVARAVVEREVGIAEGIVTSLKGSSWTTETQTPELTTVKSADNVQVKMQPNLFRDHSGADIELKSSEKKRFELPNIQRGRPLDLTMKLQDGASVSIQLV